MLKKFEYTESYARKRGKKEGRPWEWHFFPFPHKVKKPPYPPGNQEEPPGFEREIYETANTQINEIAKKWIEKDEKLLQDCKNYEEEYKSIKGKFQEELQSLSQREKEVVSKYRKAEQDFERLKKPFISQKVYWPIIILLSIFEIPINGIVFRIFGEREEVTLMLAIGLGVAIIAYPKLAGIWLREEKLSPKISKLFKFLLIIPMILMFLCIAYFRWEYYQATGVAQILNIHVSGEFFFTTFFIINIFIIGTCTFLSYFSTPENPEEYKKIEEAYKIARKKYKELLRKKKNLDELENQFKNIKIAFQKCHISRTKIFDKFKAEADEIIKKASWYVEIYRDANIQAAKDARPKPPCFDIEPSTYIEIPDKLKKLDGCENCIYLVDFAGLEKPVIKKESEDFPFVPFVITESENPESLFNEFIIKTGLEEAFQKIKTELKKKGKDINLFLKVEGNPRNSEDSQIWKNAWENLINEWNEIDKTLKECFPGKSIVYCIYPHIVLPLSFAIGASVGLRRSIILYHYQDNEFFKALDLTKPRETLFPDPNSIDPNIEIGEEKRLNNSKNLILHIFISSRHQLRFENHPDHQNCDNIALIYQENGRNSDLPKNDWTPHIQNFVYRIKKFMEETKYEKIEICFVCPSVIAFALGMAFSMTFGLGLCHWFSNKYKQVFESNEIVKKYSSIFS